MTDVGAQKISSLQRSVARAREAYTAAGADIRTSYTLQDVAVLNVIRACNSSSLGTFPRKRPCSGQVGLHLRPLHAVC